MKKHFWVLQHTVPFSDNYHDFTRTIGIFSTREKAREAKEFIKSKKGFSEFPGKYYIGNEFIDFDSWAEGFIDD